MPLYLLSNFFGYIGPLNKFIELKYNMKSYTREEVEAGFLRPIDGYIDSTVNIKISNQKTKVLVSDMTFSEDLTKKCDLVISIDEFYKRVEELSKDSVFLIYTTAHEDMLPMIEEIIRYGGFFMPPLMYTWDTEFNWTNKNVKVAIDRTLAKNEDISHFMHHKAEILCEAIEICKEVEGDVVEVGVYKGGSALVFAEYMTAINTDKSLFLLDTYTGFDYSEANTHDFYFFESHVVFDTALEAMSHVRNVIGVRDYPVEIIKNNSVSDPVPSNINKIAVLHVDVDCYTATKMTLNKFAPLVSHRGVIMTEDSVNTPGLVGALYAVEEFLKTKEGKKFVKVFKKSHHMLIKVEA